MAGDELKDYPCPWLDEISGYPCPRHPGDEPCRADCTNADNCVLLPIYRRHMALRDAVLGDMTPEEAGKMYRRYAEWEHAINKRTHGPDKAHFDALADEVAKL